MKTIVFLLSILPAIALARTEYVFQKPMLKFFLDHAHPQTGLVRDKAPNFAEAPASNRIASIAATGFGLAVLANAAESGLLDRDVAEAQILKTLKFAQTKLQRRRGWFFHFVDWETGARAWQSEYSPIDSTFFFAGALYASEVFRGGEIARIAYQLYEEADFVDFMTDGGTKPSKRTMSLSYSPERGYEGYQWSIYAEQQLMLLLGIGHPTKPLPVETWFAYSRYSPISIFYGMMGFDMPLFVHQYSAVFFDFRKLNDGSFNYFQNGIRISKAHRDMVKTAKYKTFKEGFWGLSAGEDPEGYKVYNPISYRGTVCLGCAVASAMYTGSEVLSDLASWSKGKYKEKIYGRYGLVDSIDLERNWFAQDVLGITVGPAYMSLSNLGDEHSIWRDFMNVNPMRVAIKRIQENR